MKRTQGFTLVELLVVMAIIAILASIAVPNIVGHIEKAKVTKAVAEVNGIELALTSILSDAKVSNLQQLFNPDTVRAYIFNQPGSAQAAKPDSPALVQPLTRQAFLRAQELYTRTFYAILREGRQVLVDSDLELDPTFPQNYAFYLKPNVVKNLGLAYMSDIGFDPWKTNLYQIFPGPWPAPGLRPDLGQGVRPPNPVPFRIYTVDQTNRLPGTRAGGRVDNLTLVNVVDPDTQLTDTIGYAPSRDALAFIYSYGANLISGQGLYANDGYQNQDKTVYYQPQETFLMGGGDDINNWDNDGSWGRHYN